MTFLSGLMADVDLSMDKTIYRVGEKPTYRITGAPAGAQIAWTSYKNGAATGEYQAFYQQYTDEQGNASIPAAQPWDASHVGAWRKDVVIIPKDYPNSPLQNDTVSFTVSSISQASQSTPPVVAAPPVSSGSITDIFSGTVELPIVGEVPTMVLIGGGLLLVLAVSSGGSKR